MSIAIAKNHMAEMNMHGMLAVLDQTIADATRDKISYSEFVDILLQAEADHRQERKAVNRIKAATPAARSKSSTPGRVKIPHHCDGEMDDYASA